MRARRGAGRAFLARPERSSSSSKCSSASKRSRTSSQMERPMPSRARTPREPRFPASSPRGLVEVGAGSPGGEFERERALNLLLARRHRPLCLPPARSLVWVNLVERRARVHSVPAPSAIDRPRKRLIASSWGMRIEFVPDDELHQRPRLKVSEPDAKKGKRPFSRRRSRS